MSHSSFRPPAAALLLAGLAAACGPATERTLVRLDGSSTVFPLSEAIAEEFQAAHPGLRVTVGISGTGGGFQKFCRGETDISNASRPIRPTEIALCERAGIGYIEVPVAYDGIVIAVHPNATWIDHITLDELGRLWAPEAQGQIRRWNQIREGWPDREIRLFGAGVDSGTYDYFTEAVIGTSGASRGDFTASEDDNVLVQGIASDELALGFLPFSYYEENRGRLKAVAIDDGQADNGAGAIMPTFDAIRTGVYQPLSRPIFIYVADRALERPEVERFVEFYLAEAPALAREVGEVPLSAAAYELALEHFRDRRLGTAFEEGVTQVGLTIEDLLARQRAR